MPIHLAAGFAEVFSIVIGVLLALGGLAVALMGAVAMTEGVLKRGGYALVSGLVFLALGLWLIGMIG
jgi:hypothetical protein